MSDVSHQDRICLKDIFRILEINTQESLKLDNSSIQLKFTCIEDLYIDDHYYLMSVLKNLIHNSVDGLTGIRNPFIRLSTAIESESNALLILVEDNGNGIQTDEMPYIFEPGYSTKYNATTGDIYRGLGLSIVKHLVEDTFKGTITVHSIPGKTTKTTLRLPLLQLEGANL